MRHAFLVVFFCIIAAPLAQAQEASRDDDGKPAPTRVEIDADANVIRFFIDGHEQAVLDAEGLHVNGSIDYSGTVADGNRYSQPDAGTQEAR